MARQRPQALWGKVVTSYASTKSIRKTALAVGLSKNGVAHALKSMGVTSFPRVRKGAESSSRKRIVPGFPGALVRDPMLMRRLYETERKSSTQIASILGVSPNTVLVGLRQSGIAPRTRAQGIRGRSRPGSSGAKHRDWKGGLTGWRKLARHRLNAAFVRPVMERDQFKCRSCGATRYLVVHHERRRFVEIVGVVKSRMLDTTDPVKFAAAVVAEHSLEDGVTLCKTCHDTYHKEHGK